MLIIVSDENRLKSGRALYLEDERMIKGLCDYGCILMACNGVPAVVAAGLNS